MGMLRVRVGSEWIDIPAYGQPGPPGPEGPEGPPGSGGGAEEVSVGTSTPTGTEELWYDTDEVQASTASTVYASKAVLDASWVNPPEGARAFTLDKGVEWTRISGGWYRANQVLAYVQMTANSTAIASGQLDVMTTPSVWIPANRCIWVTLSCEMVNSAASSWWACAIMMDGTSIQERRGVSQGVNWNEWGHQAVQVTPSSGNHTFAARIINYYNQGTVMMLGATGGQGSAVLHVQDVGGA